jgi:hypothetical protein
MADTGTMPDADTNHHSAANVQDDGHGHAPAGEPLGPVNLTSWAYAGAGAVLGLLVALALLIARGG